MKVKRNKQENIRERVMKKSLSDRIAERIRAKAKQASATERNLSLVLALREEILKAIDDGWPIKTIWDQLHEEGKIDFSYQTFRKYVVRLKPKPQKVEAGKTKEPQENETTAAEKKQTIKGFEYDPTPKKEDLI